MRLADGPVVLEPPIGPKFPQSTRHSKSENRRAIAGGVNVLEF